MIKIHQQKLTEINNNLIIERKFDGGMSNFTYFCVDKETNDKYVFRFPGDGSEIFVDFSVEMYNINCLKDLNITSETIYIDKDGYKISKYIDGYNPKENIDYTKVSSLLKKLHTSNINFKHNYNHLERLSKYESIRNTKCSIEYEKLKTNFIKIYDNLLINYINTPCHCDAQVANIIVNENDNNYYLIDWEFAAQNDIIYDIASFGNIDFSHAEKLLTYYFVKPEKEHYKRLYAWRMFQALQWHNVAMYKHEIGLGDKIGLDFNMIANKYLILSNEMFNKYSKI